jgi:hypothetical protein
MSIRLIDAKLELFSTPGQVDIVSSVSRGKGNGTRTERKRSEILNFSSLIEF